MFQQEIAVTSCYIFRSLAKLEKTRVFLNLFQIEPTVDTRSKPQSTCMNAWYIDGLSIDNVDQQIWQALAFQWSFKRS